MKRQLNETEKTLILCIAGKLPHEQKAQLPADLANATVNSETDDGRRITFEINGYSRPTVEGQHTFGVEGKATDRDGTDLTILLFADENGRLYELEVIRWGEGNVIGPDLRTLNLY